MARWIQHYFAILHASTCFWYMRYKDTERQVLVSTGYGKGGANIARTETEAEGRKRRHQTLLLSERTSYKQRNGFNCQSATYQLESFWRNNHRSDLILAQNVPNKPPNTNATNSNASPPNRARNRGSRTRKASLGMPNRRRNQSTSKLKRMSRLRSLERRSSSKIPSSSNGD